MLKNLFPLCLGLSLLPMTALANCPAVSDIIRIQGTYNWKVISTDDWVAYFAGPAKGRGYSTKITDFSEARWTQLNNLPTSQGFVECDYLGNYGSEIIRVTQKDHVAIPRPKNENWNYTLNTTFPSVASTCASSIETCIFK